MSARKSDMHQLQEVIRLHRLGESRRTIAGHLRMGRRARQIKQIKDIHFLSFSVPWVSVPWCAVGHPLGTVPWCRRAP